jgi:hypothetical protein
MCSSKQHEQEGATERAARYGLVRSGDDQYGINCADSFNVAQSVMEDAEPKRWPGRGSTRLSSLRA